MSNCPKHYTGEHCFWERYTISPTSNDWKKGHILVDRCSCGIVNPVFPDRLTYHQKRWLARWNARTERYWNEQS